MYYYDAPYFGMHFFWWVFWGVLWVSFFAFLTPVPRRRWQALREKPFDILQRRLASGEIDEAEYERRRTVLERDGRQDSSRLPPRAVNVQAPVRS
jgi:putative membrane protein